MTKKFNLKQGEQVIETLFPEEKLRLKQRDLLKIPVGAIMLGAAYYASIAVENKDLSRRALIGLLVFGGLYLIFGKLFFQEKKHSKYVITNKRVVFINEKTGNADWFYFNEIEKINREVFDDGLGSIVFKKPQIGTEGETAGLTVGYDELEFENIPNAEKIYTKILDLKNQ